MADQTRLDELLDQWEEAREEGQELTAEELCRDCPELLDEVKRQIEALRKIDGELNTNRGDSSAESTMDEIRSHDSVAMHCDLTDLRFHARGGLRDRLCSSRREAATGPGRQIPPPPFGESPGMPRSFPGRSRGNEPAGTPRYRAGAWDRRD